MSHRKLATALLLVVISTGCDSATVAAPQVEAAPRTSFMNGPSSLLYVMRFETRRIAGWVDFERNTAIIIGAPLDPTTSRLCGGTVRNQFVPIQFVGDFEGVIKELELTKDANVLVYDEIAPTLEEALCESEPAATGVGYYMRSDNDLLGTGGNRGNAFSEHVHAQVELTGGGTGTVSGHLAGLGLNGALVFAKTSVVFNTTGP